MREKLKPLFKAVDNFLFETPEQTASGPHIRDSIDIKRWMMLVVYALLPCFFMGIWNSGLQSFVFSSGDYRLMDEFIAGKESLSSYFAFAFKDGRWISILKEGAYIVFPLLFVVYLVGGFWETLFAVVRGHDISEGFFVTGILFVLIMPPTIPLWMAAVAVSVGIIFAKEVFGGSGMNIVNPALACRAFLFFAYPGKMTGNVWVGSDSSSVRRSLLTMNKEAAKASIDGYTQATPLGRFNIASDIKRIHVDAIASNNLGIDTPTMETIQKSFSKWQSVNGGPESFGELGSQQLRLFVTSPVSDNGLGLSSSYFEDAYHFAKLQYGAGDFGDWHFFLGDKLGAIGETSVLACLIGALFLIYTGVASWRVMLSMGLGAFFTALLFQFFATFFGADGGAWNPAQFAFPAYKHLLLGGFAFGAVFMATDPVSSADIPLAKYIYGAFIGVLVITIRVVNPAFPEGVMLAILMGNVFAPLFDYYAALFMRKRRKQGGWRQIA